MTHEDDEGQPEKAQDDKARDDVSYNILYKSTALIRVHKGYSIR